jgi:hypothetical protein
MAKPMNAERQLQSLEAGLPVALEQAKALRRAMKKLAETAAALSAGFDTEWVPRAGDDGWAQGVRAVEGLFDDVRDVLDGAVDEASNGSSEANVLAGQLEAYDPEDDDEVEDEEPEDDEADE